MCQQHVLSCELNKAWQQNVFLKPHNIRLFVETTLNTENMNATQLFNDLGAIKMFLQVPD